MRDLYERLYDWLFGGGDDELTEALEANVVLTWERDGAREDRKQMFLRVLDLEEQVRVLEGRLLVAETELIVNGGKK